MEDDLFPTYNELPTSHLNDNDDAAVDEGYRLSQLFCGLWDITADFELSHDAAIASALNIGPLNLTVEPNPTLKQSCLSGTASGFADPSVSAATRAAPVADPGPPPLKKPKTGRRATPVVAAPVSQIPDVIADLTAIPVPPQDRTKMGRTPAKTGVYVPYGLNGRVELDLFLDKFIDVYLQTSTQNMSPPKAKKERTRNNTLAARKSRARKRAQVKAMEAIAFLFQQEAARVKYELAEARAELAALKGE